MYFKRRESFTETTNTSSPTSAGNHGYFTKGLYNLECKSITVISNNTFWLRSNLKSWHWVFITHHAQIIPVVYKTCVFIFLASISR